MKRNFLKSLFAATAILAMGAGFAQAQIKQADTNMEVRVEIVDGCTVNLIGGTQVDFSARTQIINDYLTREVNVNCTLGNGTGSPSGTPTPTTYSLRLPNSAANGGTADARIMKNAAGNSIYYTVRQANTCSSALWGWAAASEWINGNFPTAAGGNRHAFNVCIDRAHNSGKSVNVDNPPLGLYADTLQIQLYY